MWAISISLSLLALMTGKSPVIVGFEEFISYSLPPYILSLVIFSYVKLKGQLRPADVKLVSWENALFELARWPWVIVACFDAILSVATKKARVFKVTSKGKASSSGLSIKILTPYLVVASFALVTITLRRDGGRLGGYYWFSQLTAWVYLCLSLAVVWLHLKENVKERKISYVFHSSPQLLWSFVVAALLLVSISNSPDFKVMANRSKNVNNTNVQQQMSGQSDVQDNLVFDTALTATPSATQHIVKVGESLWKISRKYYGKGAEWTKIQTENGSKIVHPGDVVTIVK